MDQGRLPRQLPPYASTLVSAREQASQPKPKLGRCSTTFRVRGIPAEYDTADTIKLLKLLLDLIDNDGLSIRSLAVDATNTASKTATIDFQQLPIRLTGPSQRDRDSSYEFEYNQGQQCLLIDKAFLGFTTLASPPFEEHKFDIIALSGLGGHAFGSFKQRGGDHMWLRDSLPHKLRTSRVLTYGYDSQLLGSDSFQDLEALGRSFIEGLRTFDSNLLPKIFICHSLGGLIIKQAIILMHKQTEYHPILDTTYGIYFFGVPSQGMNISALRPMVKDQPNEPLLLSLGPNSQLLREQIEEFKRIISHRDLELACYYETRESSTAQNSNGKWNIDGPPQILVDRNSAQHGFELGSEGIFVDAINKDHSNLVKFANGESALQRVLARLQKLEQGRNHLFTPSLIDIQKECLRSLSFPEMRSRGNNVVKATPGTCEWIFRLSEFQQWRRGDTGLLWIRGKPGSGKSTLFKHLLSWLEKTSRIQPRLLIISFLFNGRGSELEQTRLGMLRSLIHQLFMQRPDAFRELTKRYMTNNDTLGLVGDKWEWHVGELQDYFEQAVRSILKHSSIMLMVDALDESTENTAWELIDDFERMLKDSPATGLKLRVCFTSRHFPVLSITSGAEIHIEQQNGNDIGTFVDNKYPLLRSTKIRNKIIGDAQGVFQWVQLMAEKSRRLLIQGNSVGEILEKVNSTPELTTLYQDLIYGLDDADRDEAFRVFRWICYALRPLRLCELRLAILFQSESPPMSLIQCEESKDTKSDDAMRNRLTHLTCGLAELRTVQGTEEVQFIHQSVQDFFKGRKSFVFSNEKQAPVYSVDFSAAHSHYLLASVCMNCIALMDYELKKGRKGLVLTRLMLVKAQISRYAVENFMGHLEKIEKQRDSSTVAVDWRQLSLTFKKILPHWILLYNEMNSLRRPVPFLAKDTSLMSVIARSTLPSSILKQFLDQGYDLDARDSDGLSPLFIACQYDRKYTIQLLLDTNRVNIDSSKDNDGSTPLNWAVKYKHEEIVRMLFGSQKVDVNSKDNDGYAPLSWAVENQQKEIVQLLLNSGKVDVNSKDNKGLTPLALAAQNGHAEIVRLLLNTGKVDFDAIDDGGRTPLALAAQNGHAEIVRLLLNTGKVDFDAIDNYFRLTPLALAAQNGHAEVVRLLLNTGKVDFDAIDNCFRLTPLALAAQNGHAEVVRLLLNTGKVDFDAIDDGGRTPLALAARHGHAEIVRLLLNIGNVDFNVIDDYGHTLLSFAARNGYAEIVRLLLTTGEVDVDSKNRWGETPLMLAAKEGHEEVVRLLLNTYQVDEGQKDKLVGRLVLTWAAREKRHQVMKFLFHKQYIDHRDVDRADHFVHFNYYEDVKRLLSEWGAYVSDFSGSQFLFSGEHC